METWSDQHIVLNGARVIIDGSSYSAISRLVLLNQLQKICSDNGIEIEYSHRINDPHRLQDCDVLVGADGANSVVRDAWPEAFGTQTIDLQNYFAWYGVEQPYPAHTLTFKSHPKGVFWRPSLSLCTQHEHVCCGDRRRHMAECRHGGHER